jgi:hypothetical protein
MALAQTLPSHSQTQHLSYISPERFAKLLEQSTPKDSGELDIRVNKQLPLYNRIYKPFTGFERISRVKYDLVLDTSSTRGSVPTIVGAFFAIPSKRVIGSAAVSTACEAGCIARLDEPDEWHEHARFKTFESINMKEGILPPSVFDVRVYGLAIGGKPRVDFHSSELGILNMTSGIPLPPFAPKVDWFLTDRVFATGYDS